MADSSTTRILDAAVNRTHEGLRVIEDYVRFGLDDMHLTELLKQLRHELKEAWAALPTALRHAARDTRQDVGTQISTAEETTRVDAWDVCQASCERVKQSLRSLEEYSKISSPAVAAKMESLRYRFYTIERSLSLTQTNRMRLRDVNLCALIDGRTSVEQFTALARQLISAGVPMIQLRDKRLCDAELVERARMLVELARGTGSLSLLSSDSRSSLPERTTLVVVNDRADIGAAADADGVHLGQEDLSVKDARRIVGPGRLIGVSTHNIEQARAAILDGANYLGAGPTFPSSTKEFAEFPGLEFLRLLATEITLPTFAIGGISEQNLAEVLATGISRVAASVAVAGASNPRETASDMLKALREVASR